MRKSYSSQAGYTLIELLVVLAILGMLAAISTPMVLHYLAGAKLSTAKVELSNLEAGLDLFKYDTGRYPTTDEGVQALVKAPPGTSNWNGPYIKQTSEVKDPWGRPYHYRCPGEHGDYDLYSTGSEKEGTQPGGKPAVANW